MTIGTLVSMLESGIHLLVIPPTSVVAPVAISYSMQLRHLTCCMSAACSQREGVPVLGGHINSVPWAPSPGSGKSILAAPVLSKPSSCLAERALTC